MSLGLKAVYEQGVKAGREQLAKELGLKPSDPPTPVHPSVRNPAPVTPTCDCFVIKGMTFDRQLGIFKCTHCDQYEDFSGKTPHQQRIEHFMTHINHQVEPHPVLPPVEVRWFRARLILEETLETIKALGYDIVPTKGGYEVSKLETHAPNLIEVVDGCADISVVTIGTLSACGVKDRAVLEAVDRNNISKFEPPCPHCGDRLHMLGSGGDPQIGGSHTGWSCYACETHYPKEVGGYHREDGKWVKGTAHKKVDLVSVIAKQLPQ